MRSQPIQPLLLALSAITITACGSPLHGSTTASASTASASPVVLNNLDLSVSAGRGIDTYVVYAHVCCVDSATAQGLRFHAEQLAVWLQDTEGHDLHRTLTPDPGMTGQLKSARANQYGVGDNSFGFHLDVASLQHGWYQLTVAELPGFITTANGSQVEARDFHIRSLKIYVPEISHNSAAGRWGTLFMLLPYSTHGQPIPTIRDRNGNAVSIGQVAARPLKFLGLDKAPLGSPVVHFQVASGIEKNEVFFVSNNAGPDSIPGFYQLVDDASTNQLRSTYSGRRIWAYGNAVFYSAAGDITGGVSPDSPVDVVTVYRSYGLTESMALGTPNIIRPGTFMALNPLIVTLRVPPLHQTGSGLDAPVDGGPNAYWMLYDAPDFARNYSLRSMESAHPEWSQTIRADIRARKVKLGMTRDMIAWMFGYPTVSGTIAELNRLDRWPYDEPTPEAFSIEFRHGRVVKYTLPVGLP